MNKETVIDLNLNPYFKDTIETNIVVWSHDKNSYRFNFNLFEYLKKNPFYLIDGEPRIILEFLNSKNQAVHIYPLDIDDAVKGLAHFIVPDKILGYQGYVKASITVDFEDKTHDLGNFTFEMKRSAIDKEEIDLENYVKEFGDAKEQIEKIKGEIGNGSNEINEQIDKIKEDVTKELNDSNAKVDEIKDLIIENDVLKKTEAGPFGDFREWDDTLIAKMKNEFTERGIRPESFGAVGDGVTDDYVALQKALDFGGTIYLTNKYATSKALFVKKNTNIKGLKEDSQIINISNQKTIVDNNESENALLILKGTHIKLSDFKLLSKERSESVAICFVTSYMNTLTNLKIDNFDRAFKEFKTVFMTEFNQINCLNCNNAFVLEKLNIEKTSLKFTNCWAENCGQAYMLKRSFYSSFDTCGADYCNYVTDTNPYKNSIGEKSTGNGIYDFYSCRGLTLKSIAAENSFGNGLLRAGSSSLSVEGMIASNIKSEYKADYSTYPNFSTGHIQIHDDKSRISISNFHADGILENSNSKFKSLIAYNYNEHVYGKNNETMIIVKNTQKLKDYPIFYGIGDYENDCLYLDSMNSNMHIKNSLEMPFKTIKAPKKIFKTKGKKIIIPIDSQPNQNIKHLLNITIINATYNSTELTYDNFKILVNSLNEITKINVVEPPEKYKISKDGSTVVIESLQNFEDIILSIDILSENKNLIKLDDIKVI